jgi:hypothetical protein
MRRLADDDNPLSRNFLSRNPFPQMTRTLPFSTACV